MSKSKLHPLNAHRGFYDFQKLSKAVPLLKEYLYKGPKGFLTMDFTDPKALRMLNKALLDYHYGIEHWDIPEENLCPAVPGRADYIHYLADLFRNKKGMLPQKKQLRVLDIGTGANLIYPLLGASIYNWKFIAVDCYKKAIEIAEQHLKHNPKLAEKIDLRLQKNPKNYFKGILKEGERCELMLCNPPFYSSPKAAAEASERKWKNLNREEEKAKRNFSGNSKELWTEGGESVFIEEMIRESRNVKKSVVWFTTLVSQQRNLPKLRKIAERMRVKQYREIEMGQGQKKSRFIAWSYYDDKQLKGYIDYLH